MTKINNPGKDSDDNQDSFGKNNEPVFGNHFDVNGVAEDDDDTSSDDENVNDEEHENGGYRLLPQDQPQSNRDQQETDFADFETHFQDPPNDGAFSNENAESSGNPSIQTMILQSRQAQVSEETQERLAIFASSSTGAVAIKESDSLSLDKSKIEKIKASMSKVNLKSEPPKWLQEMSEEEWNKMLQQKLKK
jgi:hypothetical protein